MPIVCPHCATSYAIDPAKLGARVRCARCKEVWTALPELALAADIDWHGDAPTPQTAAPPETFGTLLVDSPSIAAGLPAGEAGTGLVAVAPVPQSAVIDVTPTPAAAGLRTTSRRRSERRSRPMALFRLPTAVAAMGALIAALLMWRGDVVRLMPQTAGFYKTIGLEVNLRGLSFRDVKLGNETVEGKPVLVIEGTIIDNLKKPLEIPRLRFVVRDIKGTAVYAWNAAPEQSVIQPGQRVAFRTRLAQPPDDAHSIDVRFFHKRDLAAGAA